MSTIERLRCVSFVLCLCQSVRIHAHNSHTHNTHTIPTLPITHYCTHKHTHTDCWCSFTVSKAINKTEPLHEKGESVASVVRQSSHILSLCAVNGLAVVGETWRGREGEGVLSLIVYLLMVNPEKSSSLPPF